MLSFGLDSQIRKTKIVCTLAREAEPGSEEIPKEIISEAMIERLQRRGMNVARINMSHGDIEENSIIIERVRRVARRFGVAEGIMIDVPGPKRRSGPTVPGELTLARGDSIVLTSRDIVGSQSVVSVVPAGIHNDATVGGAILLADGIIRLIAQRVEGEDVHCRVDVGGIVTEGRGVITPGKEPSLPSLDDKGEEALVFAAEQGAEFVALSFVNKPEDVRNAREILNDNGANPLIISKIETVDALRNFDGILAASDAIMVARGDMGVNVSRHRIPSIQKELIAKCNAAGKPVITATQMMESMMRSESPFRAEVQDVASAIDHGTDAVMLSGETAIGWYPEDTVYEMAQTALQNEDSLPYDDIMLAKSAQTEQRTDDAIAYATVRVAHQIDAKLIVVFTESGSTAVRVSKYRPKAPILALTPYESVRNRLTLNWATMPEVVSTPQSGDDIFEVAIEEARKVRGTRPKDYIVVVAGLPMGTPGSTNLIHVMTIS